MKLKIILALLLISSLAFSQGFSRVVGKDRIYSVHEVLPITENVLRLGLGTYYTGAGPNSGTSYYGLYYKDRDSLGHLESYSYSSSALIYRNAYNYYKDPMKVLTSIYECCLSLQFRYVNLKDTNRVNRFFSPTFSGAFNVIIKNDSAFGLRGLHRYYDLTASDFANNDSLILVYIDGDNGRLVDLDTLDFSEDLRMTGTLKYHPDSNRFELVYDSLHAYFSKGDTGEIQFSKHKNFIWKHAFERYPQDEFPFDRCFYLNTMVLNGGIRRDAYDTLDSRWVSYTETEDGSAIDLEAYYTPIEFRDSAYTIKGGLYQKDGVYVYVARKNDSSAFIISRYENRQLKKQVVYPFDKSLQFSMRTILSLADGSFYLGGRVNYKNQSGWDSRSDGYLVYIDKNGRSQTVDPPGEFQISYFINENRIKLFFKDPNRSLNYRILDASGRSLKEGRIIAHQGIQLGDWRTGIYYLQLWTPGGDYLGQSSFLKSN